MFYTEALEETMVITAIKKLYIDFGVKRTEEAQLAVLLANEGLPHGGQLDIEIVFDQVEVGCEHLDRTVVTPLQRELVRLVKPLDAVIVEQAGELRLALMVKLDTADRDYTGAK